MARLMDRWEIGPWSCEILLGRDCGWAFVATRRRAAHGRPAQGAYHGGFHTEADVRHELEGWLKVQADAGEARLSASQRYYAGLREGAHGRQ
jgi:hypothetical protein